jgi:hypothetical protein
MIINVLYITGNIEFAISIKSALERTGAFEVRPFTTPDAAIEFLRETPHDVVLVDFTIPDVRIDIVVQGLRSISPDIAIVAMPRQHEEVQRLLRLQNSVDAPFSARYIIPVLSKAVADAKRLAALKAPPPPETLPEEPIPEPRRPTRPIIKPLSGPLRPKKSAPLRPPESPKKQTKKFAPPPKDDDTPVVAPDDAAAVWQRTDWRRGKNEHDESFQEI